MHPQYTCDRCGKSFTGRTWNRNRFCSRACQHAGPLTDPVERLWSKVDRSGGPDTCWLWTSKALIGRPGQQYGSIKVNRKVYPAHRYAYILAHGPIPDNLQVCHACDNTLCCNDAHLFLGTQTENMQDMIRKGRKVVHRGSRHVNAILTEPLVLEIREQYAHGAKIKHLAVALGVHRDTIYKVVTRRSWVHV